jgi:hypothetical protein
MTMSENGEIDWAGVRFVPLHHHDARMMRAPGLYAFVRRQPWGERSLLYVGHADCVAEQANSAHPHWADALQLGMNEVDVCLKPQTRIDRLILHKLVVDRLSPILNILGADPAEVEPPLSLWAGRRCA